jgi:hypothetical protein
MSRPTHVPLIAAGLAALLGLTLAHASAQAVTPTQRLSPSLFELDGDRTPGNDTPQGPDWSQSSGYLWANQVGPIASEANKVDTTPKSVDESFAQGAKSDSIAPTVETGSIPPNKSDLTRMLVASQVVNNDVFLYLAWERSNTLGSANMNFELNTSPTPSANDKTPARTTGDVLITFDFGNGGSSVNLGLSRWGQSTCEAGGAKSPDCWSPLQDLDASGLGRGAVSADGTFGEAAINLTDAGVFPAGQCLSLGSAFLSSRSSDSFTAALKDFIAPAAVSISNCGSIEITKTDDANPANRLTGATFTLYRNVAPLTAPRDPATDTVINPAKTCTTGADGKCTITGVIPGTYWVVETTVPTGYGPAPDWPTSITGTENVTHTFVNPRLRGAILITKTAKFLGTGVNPGLVGTFSVSTSEGVKSVSTEAATGTQATACLTGLLLGTYTVSETEVPPGYTGPPSVTGVVVNSAATDCSTPGTYATASFENRPRSDISVGFAPQVTGATGARISCAGLTPSTADSTPDAYDDTTESYLNLVPGTYTCTVVIDP